LRIMIAPGIRLTDDALTLHHRQRCRGDLGWSDKQRLSTVESGGG